MSWPQQLQQWAGQVRQDPGVRSALVWKARQQGAPPGEAQDQAEEALSEAVTRSVPEYRRGRFADFAHYRNWVRRVAANWLCNQGRADARLQRHRRALVRVELAIHDERQYQLLLDELNALPPDDQELLRLYYWEGRTAAEIADDLDDGRPRQGRAGRIYRRLAALREQLRRRLELRDFEAGAPAVLERTTE